VDPDSESLNIWSNYLHYLGSQKPQKPHQTSDSDGSGSRLFLDSAFVESVYQDPDSQEEKSGQGIHSFGSDCDEFGSRSDTELSLRCPTEFVQSG
jgi:hypothetical protein